MLISLNIFEPVSLVLCEIPAHRLNTCPFAGAWAGGDRIGLKPWAEVGARCHSMAWGLVIQDEERSGAWVVPLYRD